MRGTLTKELDKTMNITNTTPLYILGAILIGTHFFGGTALPYWYQVFSTNLLLVLLIYAVSIIGQTVWRTPTSVEEKILYGFYFLGATLLIIDLAFLDNMPAWYKNYSLQTTLFCAIPIVIIEGKRLF